MSIDNNFITSIKHIQKDIDEILSKYPFPDNPKYLYKPLKYELRSYYNYTGYGDVSANSHGNTIILEKLVLNI